VTSDLATVDVKDSTWYKFTNVCPDRDVGSTDQPLGGSLMGGGGITDRVVQIPLGHKNRCDFPETRHYANTPAD
jgi:hypothetical protein